LKQKGFAMQKFHIHCAFSKHQVKIVQPTNQLLTGLHEVEENSLFQLYTRFRIYMYVLITQERQAEKQVEENQVNIGLKFSLNKSVLAVKSSVETYASKFLFSFKISKYLSWKGLKSVLWQNLIDAPQYCGL
jgi:hypothetical protein